MIEITSVRMVGGVQHEHIANLKWKNLTTASVGETSRQGLVDWLNAPDNQAIVRDGDISVSVGVVNPVGAPSYVRTYADGVWKDNLLALPRYS
jgi:hypothetical protein